MNIYFIPLPRMHADLAYLILCVHYKVTNIYEIKNIIINDNIYVICYHI